MTQYVSFFMCKINFIDLEIRLRFMCYVLLFPFISNYSLLYGTHIFLVSGPSSHTYSPFLHTHPLSCLVDSGSDEFGVRRWLCYLLASFSNLRSLSSQLLSIYTHTSSLSCWINFVTMKMRSSSLGRF